jgi:hypothetical protein
MLIFLSSGYKDAAGSSIVGAYLPLGKGKVYPVTDHEGPDGEERYSSTHSLTWY